MNMNFGKNIAEMTEQELLVVVNNYSIEGAQVAMGELNRRATKELKVSIDGLSKATDFYSQLLIGLTFLLAMLAVYQGLLTIIQPDRASAVLWELGFGVIIFATLFAVDRVFRPKKKKVKK